MQMRLSGVLKSWNDDRGFGFIAQSNGGMDLFVHISSMSYAGTRPSTGEKLTYELGQGKDGKPQAIKVTRDTGNLASKEFAYYAERQTRAKPKTPSFPRISLLLIIAVLGVFGFQYYQTKVDNFAVNETSTSPAPTTAREPVTELRRSLDTSPTNFSCDGRTHCSQMTSCAEAKFFLKNCPNTKMDGNNDGEPCEQQWCTNE